MRELKEMYQVYSEYFAAERKACRESIGILFASIILLSIGGGTYFYEDRGGYNFYLMITGLISLLLVIVRFKYIDMRYTGQNEGSFVESMRYAPIDVKKIVRFTNRKMWCFSIGILIFLFVANYIAYSVNGDKWGELDASYWALARERMKVWSLVEVMYVFFLTLLLNAKKVQKRTGGNGMKKVIFGCIGVLLIGLAVCNLPMLYFVNTEVHGIVANLEDEEYYEANLVVDGIFRQYLIKDNQFQGVIFSESLQFNEEQDELKYTQDDWIGGGGLSVIHFGEGLSIDSEYLGNLYTDCRFRKVCVEIYDQVEKDSSGTSYSHEKWFFVGNVSTVEEAREVYLQMYNKRLRKYLD